LVVAGCRGEVDLSNAERFAADLRDCVHEDSSVLVVDLSGVGFLALAWVEVLAALAHSLAEAGVQLRVVTGSRSAAKVVRVSGLGGTVPCLSTVDAAVNPGT
jgi:anti-anti-sigma factor